MRAWARAALSLRERGGRMTAVPLVGRRGVPSPQRLAWRRGGKGTAWIRPARRLRARGGKVRRRDLSKYPRYWRDIAPPLGGGIPVEDRRLNGWLLVLAAKRIPHVFSPGRRPRLYVPPVCEGVALHEIAAFENERPALLPAPPVHDNAWAVFLLLFALVAWHGLRFGWLHAVLPSPPFPPSASDWPAAFGLDVYRTRALHQWWRAATALFIHSDDGHLAANVGFGLVFLIPLFRRTGAGMGLALTVLSGICGNVGNALFREANVLSLGFSTALFGAVGALCSVTAMDVAVSGGASAANRLVAFAGRIFPSVGAGLALLGLLGGGGEPRTDYAAHIWGFCSGVALGCSAWPLESPARASGHMRVLQTLLFFGVTFCVTVLWWWRV